MTESAVQFGEMLRLTMARRGVTARELHRATGLSETAISNWFHGLKTPMPECVVKLSDALQDSRLTNLYARLMQGTCVCGKTFARLSTKPKQAYCSMRCNRREWQRRKFGFKNQQRAYVAERLVSEFSTAVVAFCKACEPDGVCAQSKCPLRSVSPLPLRRAA